MEHNYMHMITFILIRDHPRVTIQPTVLAGSCCPSVYVFIYETLSVKISFIRTGYLLTYLEAFSWTLTSICSHRAEC